MFIPFITGNFYICIMEKKIITTEDGSHTLWDERINENYHNTHGAIKESEHIFIRQGYQQAGKWLNPLNILEVGFGTGLNALLSYKANLSEKRKLNYLAVEPFPLENETIEALNYHELLDIPEGKSIFKSLHKQSDTPYFIGEQFIIMHLKHKLQELTLKEESLNVIYFDAFAPSVQPEIWEKEIFQKLYTALEKRGLLVTYSASGNVKRALSESGFKLEHPEGPEGKREITVAHKPICWQQIFS